MLTYILFEDLSQKVASLDGELLGDGDFLVKNLVHLLHERQILIRLERIHPRQHLVQHETETVPVHRVPVILISDYLRRQVFRRPTETFRAPLRVFQARLGQAKVCQANMALLVDKYILRLEIAIDDSRLV